MVYRKRSSRKTQRPRRYAKRSMRPARSLRAASPSLTVTKTCWRANWLPSTVATANFWQYYSARIGHLSGIAEYAALFDTYRINWYKITFRPRFTDVDQANTTKSETQVHVIVDPRTTTVPTGTYTSTNLNSFLENGRVKTYSGTKPFSFLVKYPCIVNDINTTAGARFERSPYISTTQTNIDHQGAHIFMADGNLSGVFGQQFDVYFTINATFKGMK